MFACLLIRRPRRLQHLRRLAATGGPATRTRLPGPLLSAPQPEAVPAGLPAGFRPASPSPSAPAGPAAVDAAELSVRARLHHYVQHGAPSADAAQHSCEAPQTTQEKTDG
ncbi:hypothetical protein [Streptomyces sp. NPDC015125]|uniref:hypothetical protein n=1 Tax=Streptomyces sp. NPDC015125 TaxID=3364938 RepID=UPI0036FECB23